MIEVEATCAANLPSATVLSMRKSLFDLFAQALSRGLDDVAAVRVLNNANATGTEVFNAFINLHQKLKG
jgi:hypothetical protein